MGPEQLQLLRVQSGPGINKNEGVLDILKRSRTGDPSSDEA